MPLIDRTIQTEINKLNKLYIHLKIILAEKLKGAISKGFIFLGKRKKKTNQTEPKEKGTLTKLSVTSFIVSRFSGQG